MMAEPSTCTVYGRIRNSMNEIVPNAEIAAQISHADVLNQKNFYVTNKTVTTTTSENGYFELELIRCSEYAASYTYNFTISFDDMSHIVRDKMIPTQEFVAFKDL
jgi:hypothetical protein